MIPELTDEQRKANLEKAMQMRKARATLRSRLADGDMSASDLVTLAKSGDKAASDMRVKQMISAMPGYGFARTQQLMQSIGIADNKRVGGLGQNQIDALIAKLDGAA